MLSVLLFTVFYGLPTLIGAAVAHVVVTRSYGRRPSEVGADR